MGQIYNPYLPLNEYVPDGEPHVFGDRVYVYGSHDVAGGEAYCLGHYVCWSAPVDDLTDWRYEGVSYRRTQDPSNADDKMQLWAPDVARGVDGRYYLYYCFSFLPEIGVAVSDSPAGPFEFYGHVKYPQSIKDGIALSDYFPFDPAVIVTEEGKAFIYYGFSPGGERANIPNPNNFVWSEGSMVAELEDDMLTLKEEPRLLIPGEKYSAGTSFEGHGFFEASSIRAIGGKYYFVYSSHKSHELCYAISDKPDRDFVYGGTIVSNGDIGLNGNTTPVYPIGNNHGGLVEADGKVYIFYHRQTNGTEFSRQGCAELVAIKEDGSIDQVEITSCGLNGGPLIAEGSYPASIACHNTCAKSMDRIDYEDPINKEITMITEASNESYITLIKDKTVIGYKYFAFVGASLMTVEVRGGFAGSILVSLDPEGQEIIGEVEIEINKEDWVCELIPIAEVSGKQAIYFTFVGEGSLDFKRFSFLNM